MLHPFRPHIYSQRTRAIKGIMVKKNRKHQCNNYYDIQAVAYLRTNLT